MGPSSLLKHFSYLIIKLNITGELKKYYDNISLRWIFRSLEQEKHILLVNIQTIMLMTMCMFSLRIIYLKNGRTYQQNLTRNSMYFRIRKLQAIKLKIQ